MVTNGMTIDQILHVHILVVETYFFVNLFFVLVSFNQTLNWNIIKMSNYGTKKILIKYYSMITVWMCAERLHNLVRNYWKSSKFTDNSNILTLLCVLSSNTFDRLKLNWMKKKIQPSLLISFVCVKYDLVSVCMRNRLSVTSIEPNWHFKSVTLNWKIYWNLYYYLKRKFMK